MSNFRIGCQVLTWGGDRIVNSLETVLSQAREAGYEGVEIGTRFLINVSPLRLKSTLKERGLVLSGLHTGLGDLDRLSEEEAITNLVRALEFAKEVETKYLVVSGWRKEGKTKEDFLKQARVLREVGNKAKSYGMCIAYHNHDWEIKDNYGELKELLNLLNPEIFSLAPDIGWVIKAGGEPSEFLETFLPRISYLHLRDLKNNDFVEFGKGTVDYHRFFNTLREKGWSGWVVLEIVGSQDSPFSDPFKVAKEGREYLKSILNT
ncbi:MAG: sugar phosphate isomerase/epimerase family protein [bacterium]